MLSNTAGRINSILANLFLVLSSVLLICIILEATTRMIFGFQAFDQSEQFSDGFHYPRPYVEAVADSRIEGINSLGYKGVLPAMPKPATEFRIIMLGGSTVFGIYPATERMKGIRPLPDHLDERLQNSYGSGVRVYNFGITSTIAQQEMARLIMDVVSYEPDLIISYGGGNDFFNTDSVGYPHRFIWSEMNPLWIKELEEYPTFHLLALGSAFVRHFFGKYLEDYFVQRFRKNRFSDKNLSFYTDSAHNYSESMRRMKVISNAFGAEFLAYFQPLKRFYFGEPEEKKMAFDFLESVEASIGKLGVENFRNLREVFQSSPESIWLDEIHISDEANSRMAEFLANDLKAFIPLKAQNKQ